MWKFLNKIEENKVKTFSPTRPAAVQIVAKKVFTYKDVQKVLLPLDWFLEREQGRRFIILGQQYGRHNVM